MSLKPILSFFFLASILTFVACSNNNTPPQPNDSPESGTIHISVDESFKPVIDAELKVYASAYPNSHIIPHYKSEADCFRDLNSDSTRMILVAKGLTPKESDLFESKLSFRPQFDAVAYDAVAIIVNINNKDSLYTLAQIKDILLGKTTTTAIMDGKNATSTVRYLQDSVLRQPTFGANVVAAAGSKAVIEAVANSTNAIGFLGLSWIGNNYEPEQQAALKKVRFALLECNNCGEKGVYAKPSQATITYKQYPLARPLYYIVKENYAGLGTGFANFLSLERGQLIFRRACLAPFKMNLNKRNTNL